MTASKDVAQTVIRRAAGPEEYPRLVAIWRSAVDATHDFLAEADRDEIQSHVASDYLPHVELHVADLDGLPVGFAGVSGESLEMLFVDARHLGQGIGTGLLSFVVAQCGVRTVDVNEQNAQAVDFYRRRGFTVVGRSEQDDQGRPLPDPSHGVPRRGCRARSERAPIHRVAVRLRVGSVRGPVGAHASVTFMHAAAAGAAASTIHNGS